VGYDDDLNLYAYVKNDPINFGDPLGKQRGAAASRLRRELSTEIRAARESGDTARVSGLTKQRRDLASPEVQNRGPIDAPRAEVSSALVQGVRGAPAENVFAAVESDGQLNVVNTTTSSSITSGTGTLPPGTTATGHKHRGSGVADNFPGVGDLVNVLITGKPAVYFNDATNVGGAIAYDGSQFTMNPVEGIQMPEYGAQDQPGYVSDTFSPW